MKNGSKTLLQGIFFGFLVALASPIESMARTGVSIEEGKSFWAFQPIQRQTPPGVAANAPASTFIDAFARAKREQTGAAAPASVDRPSLIRRLSFDLRGIPPSPAEIERFVSDASPDAYEALIERYLNSQEYAERFGRRWLATVRYADSTGGGRAMLLPEAWRYRDYVVKSFGDDKPYDRFLTEQIAGDLLASTEGQARRDAITATGFLALGPTNYELQDKVRLRMEVIDEQIDTIGQAFMGMTLGCARCHDHFFDPIPTTDYYALAGIFRSTKSLEHSNVSKWINTTLPAVTPEQMQAVQKRKVWQKQVADLKTEIGSLKKAAKQSAGAARLEGIVIDDDEAVFEGSWQISRFANGYVGERYMHDKASKERRLATYSRILPEAGEYEVRISYTHNTNRAPTAVATVFHSGGQSEVVIDQRKSPGKGGFKSLGTFPFDSETEAKLVLSNREPGNGHLIADAVAFVSSNAAPPAKPKTPPPDGRLPELESALKALEKAAPPAEPYAMSVVDEKKIADYAVNIGGDPHRMGDSVPRGFLSVIPSSAKVADRIPNTASGRLQLAEWLTARDHPLTARVYANRVWMWLIGEGIVPSPNNFGKMGEAPSDPALLDYLATRLIDQKWSTKSLVRDIVRSQTYQAERKGPPRRIDAEALRDAMLSVSGELDRSVQGGATIPEGTRSEFGYGFKELSRSIYVPVFRNQLPEIFELFDFPDPSLVADRPGDSTLATQALFLMNHSWVVERSAKAAKRWAADEASIPEAIEHAYWSCFGRAASIAEVELAETFLGSAPDEETWTAFAQSLFASVEFRHLK